MKIKTKICILHAEVRVDGLALYNVEITYFKPFAKCQRLKKNSIFFW
jgi:hypothetical protein